ncbi:MAG: VCBS repeat-containing protein, partial [Myxococcales bacterium]|nr:VCBS repeat-containing protein [Myxococcales bacterium]
LALPTLGAVAASAADLNGDGTMEILFSNTHDGASRDAPAYLYWGSGGAWPAENRQELPATQVYTEILIEDLDGDGALDLVLAVGDGRVLRATRRTLSPPTEIAVVPCPVAQACEGAGPQPLGSLDTADGATLCARFRPVAEADGHEARLVGPDGTPLTAWTPAGAGILTLPLAAARPARERGAPHTVEVRAWASGDGQRPTSAPGQGAPVLIRDRAAPQATLRVSGERDRVPAGTPLTLLVDAQDDHLVASALVELVGGDDTVWWAADVGAVALPQVAAAVGWDGQGGQPLGPVPPGAYTLRLRVGDLAGEGVTVTLGLILCDGPCE